MPRAKAEPKDPNAPKRPLNAFFLFCKDERSKVKEEHKEFKASEVTKELGRRWQEVDSVTKQKYENMVAKDKQRYDKEMNAYKNKGKGGVAQGGNDDDDDEEEEEDED